MTTVRLVCLIISVAWIAYIIWDHFGRPNRGDGKGGFWDFVKNPHRYKDLAPISRPGKAHILPDDAASDDEWDAAIRASIEKRWDTFEYGLLADRSPRVASAAARIIRDHAFAAVAWHCDQASLPHWNLSAIERLLGQSVPLEVLSHLQPFLGHKNEWCRQAAAEIVGRVDHPEAADAIRALVRSDDNHLRDGVFHGLYTVSSGREGNRDLILRLWPDLVGGLRQGRVHYSSVVTVVRRLAAADRQQAIIDLHRPDILHQEHRHLNNLLDGLRCARIPPQRSMVLELAEQAQRHPITQQFSAYHRGQVLGACLLLLIPPDGVAPEPGTEELIESVMMDQSPGARSSACRAYLTLHGITTDPQSVCWTILYERKGLLTRPQRLHWEVQQLLNEVQNGGWHQYFVNSSGNGWKLCLEGAELMGLSEVVSTLRKAAALFGTEGPDTDRDRRWEQLSRLSKHEDGIMEGLRLDGDSVEVALARFAVKHREDFLPLVPVGQSGATAED